MTTTQVKFFLKLLLLKSIVVYLLSGRSIPGVTESTPVQFHSLCGSESTFPGQWIYEINNSIEGTSMSHRQHYGDGHSHIQQTLKTKCELEIRP